MYDIATGEITKRWKIMELTIESANGSYGKVNVIWLLNSKNCEIVVSDGRGGESKVTVPKDAVKSLANALKS